MNKIHKIHILCSLLVCLAAGISSAAAIRAEHCDAAVAAITNGVSDIFVYLHGSDWCPAGEIIKNQVWDTPAFAEKFENSVSLVAIDQPDRVEGNISASFKRELEAAEKESRPAISHISAKNGSIYKPLADESWLAEKSPNPHTEQYSVRLKRQQTDTSVILLKVMTDDSLPHKGPGRDNGNVVITEIKAEAEVGGKQQKIKLTAAWADYAQKYFDAKKAVDGKTDNGNGWAIDGNKKHTSRKLALLFDKQVPAGTQITVTISCFSKWKQHTPGRFDIRLLGGRAINDAFNRYNKFQNLKNHNRSLNCGTDNYPAVLCFDAAKRLYGRIQPLPQNISSTEFADKLKALKQKRVERDRHWHKAEGYDGYHKALYLGKGLDLMGGPGGRKGAFVKEFNELKKADPDDKTGYIRKYEFPLGSINKAVGEERKNNGEEAALAMIDKEIKNPKNKMVSSSHIQDLMLTKFNMYRSWKGHEDGRYDVLREIAAFDPKTHQGIGAQGYLMYRGQADEFSLYHNWFPRHVKDRAAVWKIRYGMKKAFPHPGYYRIGIVVRGGKNSIKIKSVALVIDGKRESVDSHETTLKNRNNPDNNYYIEYPYNRKGLPAIEYEPVGGTDTKGSFSVTPVLPEDLPKGCHLLSDTAVK